MNRRRFLAATATGATAGLAGCGSGPACPPPAFDAQSPTGAWPGAGYDAGNTAHSPADPGSATFEWTSPDLSHDGVRYPSTWSPPVVGSGAVYVSTGLDRPYGREDEEDRAKGGHLLALDPASGAVRWRYGFPVGAGGAPLLHGEWVLVGDREGTLHAVVPDDGSRRWTASLGGPVRTPVAAGDRAYVTDGSGRLAAFTPTGERCWTVEHHRYVGLVGASPFRCGAGPAADGEGVYVAVAERTERLSGIERCTLLAYDHAGEERWRYGFDARDVPNHPVVADGTAYVTAGREVRAVDAATGEEAWRFVSGFDSTGPPATDGDQVYVPSKNLYALDATTGEEAWRVVNRAVEDGTQWAVDVPFLGRPAVGGGSVFLRGGAVDAATGARLWGGTLAEGATEYYNSSYTRRPFATTAVTDDALYATVATEGVRRYA